MVYLSYCNLINSLHSQDLVEAITLKPEQYTITTSENQIKNHCFTEVK